MQRPDLYHFRAGDHFGDNCQVENAHAEDNGAENNQDKDEEENALAQSFFPPQSVSDPVSRIQETFQAELFLVVFK